MVTHYLSLSVILFCLGILGVVSRRNVFIVFMSIELMLNAANLGFVALSRLHVNMDGHVLALMVMAVAAVEVAIGLAILVCFFRNRGTIAVEDISNMKG